MASAGDIQKDVSAVNKTSRRKSLMLMTTEEITKQFEKEEMEYEELTSSVYNICNEIDKNRQDDQDDFEEKIEKKRNYDMCIRKFEAIVDGLMNGKKNNVWSTKKLVALLTKTRIPMEDSKSCYTVLSLAFKCRSKEVIRKLLKLLRFEMPPNESAGSHKKEGNTQKATIVKYGVIVSGATPMTSTPNITSCLELLLQDTDISNKTVNHTIAEVLDIEPVQKIERFYNNVTTCVYLTIILLHAAYMSLFSYSSMFLMDKFRNGSVVESTDAATVIFYAVLPTEPVVVSLFYIRWLWRNYSKFRLCGNKKYTFKHIIWKFSPVLLQLVFTVLVIVSIVQFALLEKGPLHNTLSITLLLGWMTTLSYTQGVRPLRVFWKMIMHMIAIDVYKILFVYAFVLLSFSFALHIQFQLSQALIDEYPTPFHTMFFVYGLMLGVGELFDDEYKRNIREGGGTTVLSRLLFVLYTVIATLVLVNLLIAMMNTSYNEEISNLRISRRIDSLERALSLEETIGILPDCLQEPLKRTFFQSVIKTRSLNSSTGKDVTLKTETRSVTKTGSLDSPARESITPESGTGCAIKTCSLEEVKIKTSKNDDDDIVWYVQVKGAKEGQTPSEAMSGVSSNDDNLQLILKLQKSVDDLQCQLNQLHERMRNCSGDLPSDTDA